MKSLHLNLRTAIGIILFAVGVAGPIALFEATQPGHGVNKYYEELHQSQTTTGDGELATTADSRGATESTTDHSPTIVIPNALLVRSHHRS